jgi:hypothetical protein
MNPALYLLSKLATSLKKPKEIINKIYKMIKKERVLNGEYGIYMSTHLNLAKNMKYS